RLGAAELRQHLLCARPTCPGSRPGRRPQEDIAGALAEMAYHPEVQHVVAEMTLALDAVEPHLDRIAQHWSDGVDHGATWPAKIVSAKYHAVEAAKRVVDLAMELSGGAGMFKANELERLYRDVRCGGFHPANAAVGW